MGLKPPTIFIIEDDHLMADCFELAIKNAISNAKIQKFSDAFSAMSALDNNLPELILLDILLKGPDGFTFLNELISYDDTAKIPVILISSLNLAAQDLSHYGVRKIFQKDTMTPYELTSVVTEILSTKNPQNESFGG